MTVIIIKRTNGAHLSPVSTEHNARDVRNTRIGAASSLVFWPLRRLRHLRPLPLLRTFCVRCVRCVGWRRTGDLCEATITKTLRSLHVISPCSFSFFPTCVKLGPTFNIHVSFRSYQTLSIVFVAQVLY